MNKYKLTIINIIFFIFPLSIILGNFYTNLNIFFLFIGAIFFFNKEIIKFKMIFFDKIILIFFIFTFTTLIINFLESYASEVAPYWEQAGWSKIFPKVIIYKTFFYFRYYILYLTLRILISQKILRLDWFSLSCGICATFVCLDIIFQYVFGKNILGFEQIGTRHFSGVFGEELVAGGYLQKFALFTFFLPFVLKKNLFHKTSIQIIFFIFFIFGIILSGNRMPVLLFILSFFVFVLLDKNLKKYFFIFFVIICLILTSSYNLSQTFRYNAGNFYFNAKDLLHNIIIPEHNNKIGKGKSVEAKGGHGRAYLVEFYCFKTIFKKNIFFGGGIRSYRFFSGGCNVHPHNYYFEILTDLGLIGFSIILFFVFMLLRKILLKKNSSFNFSLNTIDYKIMPFFLIFVVEFFPVRTSGSFFTTSNATIIFIILSILVSLISQKKTL